MIGVLGTVAGLTFALYLVGVLFEFRRLKTLGLPADQPVMDAACGMIVLELAGWDKSVGLHHEINVFKAAGKPIVFMRLGEVPAIFVPRAARERDEEAGE